VLVDRKLGILVPLKDEEGTLASIYQFGKALADDQEAAESDRLLYVAATRAQEKLIFNGYIGLKRDGSVGKLRGWLDKVSRQEGLGLIGMPIPHDEEGANAIHLDLQVGQTLASCTIYEPGVVWERRRELGGEAQPPAILPPPLLEPVSAGIEQVDQRTSEQERIPAQRVWRVVPAVKRPRAPAWVVGSLVHEALAAWRFPNDDFQHWARARARGYGVTDAQQLINAVSRSRRLLLRFRHHPLFEEMDAADQLLHEVPYSLMVDGKLERGIIDALYLRETVWSIVEFKTDEVRNDIDFDRLLHEKDYVGQAQRYLAVAERLLGQRPRFTLCMLDYARGVYLHPVGETSGKE
jgi:ATP-dependent exoDNAse (exonuclease V) beta subunit